MEKWHQLNYDIDHFLPKGDIFNYTFKPQIGFDVPKEYAQ